MTDTNDVLLPGWIELHTPDGAPMPFNPALISRCLVQKGSTFVEESNSGHDIHVRETPAEIAEKIRAATRQQHDFEREPINVTGGIPSEEFVRHVRDGTKPKSRCDGNLSNCGATTHAEYQAGHCDKCDLEVSMDPDDTAAAQAAKAVFLRRWGGNPQSPLDETTHEACRAYHAEMSKADHRTIADLRRQLAERPKPEPFDVEAELSSESVEKYIRQLPWGRDASDHERTLVVGNIRGFARHLRDALKAAGVAVKEQGQ